MCINVYAKCIWMYTLMSGAPIRYWFDQGMYYECMYVFVCMYVEVELFESIRILWCTYVYVSSNPCMYMYVICSTYVYIDTHCKWVIFMDWYTLTLLFLHLLRRRKTRMVTRFLHSPFHRIARSGRPALAERALCVGLSEHRCT